MKTTEEIKRIAKDIRVSQIDKSDNRFATNLEETIKKVIAEKGYAINLKNKADDLTMEDLQHFAEFSGSVRKDNENEYTIRVSPFDYELRQRFTLAHELGHILLEHHFPSDTNSIMDPTENIIGRPDGTYSKNSEEEVQANRFAAELLMPENLIEEKFPDKSIRSLDEMERIAKVDFQVSKAAIMVRLNYLNYSF